MLVRPKRSGHSVTRTRSGRNGRFTLHLTPGRYLVRVSVPAPLGRTQPSVVSMTAHRFTALTLRVDSGIR